MPIATQKATRPGRKMKRSSRTRVKPWSPLWTSRSMRSWICSHWASKTVSSMAGGNVGPTSVNHWSKRRAAFNELPVSARWTNSSMVAGPSACCRMRLVSAESPSATADRLKLAGRASRTMAATSPSRTRPRSSLTIASDSKSRGSRRCSRLRSSRAPSASPAMPEGISRASRSTCSPMPSSDNPKVSKTRPGTSTAIRS